MGIGGLGCVSLAAYAAWPYIKQYYHKIQGQDQASQPSVSQHHQETETFEHNGEGKTGPDANQNAAAGDKSKSSAGFWIMMFILFAIVAGSVVAYFIYQEQIHQ